MAHFAQIDDNNIVTNVIVVHNNELLDADGVEQENLGADFCANLFGGTWKQTSYNGNIRKNFAGTGYTYDTTRDAFIAPQPFASWTLDETTCQWQPPTPKPTNGNHQWNEETQSWDEYIWNAETESWELSGA